MIILTHPTGNANLRAIAASLNAAKQLETFHTSIATFPGNVWDKIGRLPAMNDFSRRSFSEDLRTLTKQHPWRELGRMVANKTGLKSLSKHEHGTFSVDKVYQVLDRKVAATIPTSKGIKAVYAYEDGALATFKEAKKRGIKCIYDLPIAYWETKSQLIQEEVERHPEWASTMMGSIKDSAAKLARKTQELELADVVVGPGSFVMDSLPDWASNKHQIVAPFGSPPLNAGPGITKKHRQEGPLKVLFVGSLTQRKGLADLFAAMQLLDPTQVQLIVLGGLRQPLEFYKKIFPNFVYEPTRPHKEVLKLMASCDVFCLPSIVEGRALVMQEAMSQGLPVIITPNTGGADLAIHEETGFLVPIRSPEGIAKSIQWFIDHRSAIPRMSLRAQEHSANYTWAAYGDTVVQEIEQYLATV